MSNRIPTETVKVGQIWENMDTRMKVPLTDGRWVARQMIVSHIGPGAYVHMVNRHTSRKTVIALRRLRPTRNGYKLVTREEITFK